MRLFTPLSHLFMDLIVCGYSDSRPFAVLDNPARKEDNFLKSLVNVRRNPIGNIKQDREKSSTNI